MPVAGLGTRLRPQTWSKPKPLAPVAGRPMLAHVLERVLPLDPDRLVFITGYLGDQIEAWVTDNYDLPALFVEQPQMLGQTDAILRVREHVQSDALVLFPDMLFEADFSAIGGTDSDVILYTQAVEDPSSFGVAVEAEGRVVRLVEKPQEPVSNQAVVGIYYFRSMPDLYAAMDDQVRQELSLKNEYFIADAIQIMIDAGKRVITQAVSTWKDCGNAGALLETNRYLLERMEASTVKGDRVVVVPPSFVDASATIEDSVIGPYASIGRDATVRNALVRNSIVDEQALVEGAILEQSIVGRGARVAGTPARVDVSDTSRVEL
jgi:glucose-1-phosphate thymidylyltransferase